MGTLGIFVDRQTLSYSKKLSMLMRFRDVAESLGHRSYFIFPVELKKIAKLDGLLIRSRTDPLNVSYVAARMATMHGIPVIDNPEAIRVCSDKVNMYLHLMHAKVPIPRTELMVRKEEIGPCRCQELLRAAWVRRSCSKNHRPAIPIASRGSIGWRISFRPPGRT